MVISVKNYFVVMCLFFTGEVFAQSWDLYLGGGATAVERSNLLVETTRENASDFQLGLSKKIATRWRLGSGVDFVIERIGNNNRSENILTWRTMSLDYELTESLAGTFYAGMTRFYRERPAIGYGAGLGLKYRLTQHSAWIAEMNWTEVDTSTGIPRDPDSHQRDTLKWINLGAVFYF